MLRRPFRRALWRLFLADILLKLLLLSAHLEAGALHTLAARVSFIGLFVVLYVPLTLAWIAMLGLQYKRIVRWNDVAEAPVGGAGSRAEALKGLERVPARLALIWAGQWIVLGVLLELLLPPMWPVLAPPGHGPTWATLLQMIAIAIAAPGLGYVLVAHTLTPAVARSMRTEEDTPAPVPRDALPRDALPRDALPRDALPRDALPRNELSREVDQDMPQRGLPRFWSLVMLVLSMGLAQILWMAGLLFRSSAQPLLSADGGGSPSAWLLIRLIVPPLTAVSLLAWLLAGIVTRPAHRLRILLETLGRQSTLLEAGVRPLPRYAASDLLSDTLNPLIDRLEVAMKDQIELSQLKSGYQEVEEESRARSEFFANMSHEIRTPMTAIQGYAHLLLEPTLTQTERFNYVQTILRNSDHLLTVVNDILDFSKLEAGRMEVEMMDCSPGRVITEVAALMQVRALEKGLSLSVHYLSAIPESIQSDATRLRQILLNLVGNALKFTTSGGVRILVRLLDPGSSGSRLSITIEDTGVGIDPMRLAGLFQPFTQADASTSRVFGGTGLGLVISRRLARMLGGDIQVESDGRSGSSLTATIRTGPITSLKTYDSQDAVDEHERSLPGIFHAPLIRIEVSVLLAEDTPDSRMLVRTYLKKAGARVTDVENGQQALERALEAWRAGNPYQVILMDMQMPVLDGFAATSMLRAQGYPGPIVALTAFATAGERERCLTAGCNVFLTKPIDRDKLIEVVRAYSPHDDWHVERFFPKAGPLPTAKPVPEVGVSAPESNGGVALEHAASAPSPEHVEGDSRARIDAEGTTGLPRRSVDQEALYSDLDHEEDLVPLIAMFVADLPLRRNWLTAAAAEQDQATLQGLAHQLRGVAGGFGFQSITDAAADVEDAIRRSDDPSVIAHHLDELLRLCERARVRGEEHRSLEGSLPDALPSFSV